MPDRPCRSAIAFCTWLTAAIAAGSWSAHFFYNGGLALADVARRKPINAPLDWLADNCREASFADFHRSAILGTVVLALLPFLHHLLRKPDGPLWQELRETREHFTNLRQTALAFALCTTLSLSFSLLLHGRSISVLSSTWVWAVAASCLVAIAIEILFRGVAQRILTAAMGTKRAIFATAAVYLVFLSALFPHGIDAWMPALSSERFPLLQSLASGLASPAHLTGQTLPLLLLGILLSWTRTRSPSLWLVIGIQSGILLTWHMTSDLLPTLLAALSTVYVFCGRPAFRNPPVT